MASSRQVNRLLEGVNVWNDWRRKNKNTKILLREADLSGAELRGANLAGANLYNANLSAANLRDANLSAANITFANLTNANLTEAYLGGAVARSGTFFSTSLTKADLILADFSGAKLDDADLTEADLQGTKFCGSILNNANFTRAKLGITQLTATDIHSVVGLESVTHMTPSSIGTDTLFLSKGKIPHVFLRGCGVPEELITYMSSLVNNPIEYYSCFISYSHKDEDFAQRLYSGLRDKNMRVWYAPEDMKGGEKIHEQIDAAIQLHDRLLLILSEQSMGSEWVRTEIYKARQREIKEKRRILFPVALVPFEKIKAWEFFDGDTGKDLAREIREYYIPDFSNWKDHDSFELEFGKLVRDLKAASSK